MRHMSEEKKSSKIIPFPNKQPINIGIIIFSIIFIYLLASVIMYITAPHTTVYEVRQGSILKDNAYTGLAIRDEIVVNATEGGYINYYAPDTSKVKVGEHIYTLSEEKLDFTSTTSETPLELSTEEERNLVLQVQKFVVDYDENKFESAYELKEELKDSLDNFHNQSKLEQLSALIESDTTANIQLYSTIDDGIVVHAVDGLEDLTVDSAKVSHLNKDGYKETRYANNAKVKSGDAVYKIITDDAWTIMIETDQETAIVLQEKKYIKVNFTKDQQSLWATLETKIEDGHYLAFLSFDTAMVRYAKERYLDIELILEDETGLKIPKSSMTEKEFFIVPMSYITHGGNSSKDGVLIQSKNSEGKTITEFINVTIYYEDQEFVYLDPNEFEKEVTLLKPESDEMYTLKEKKKLKGVYCINKGYAMFKQIKILCESDAYYIVEEGNSYGLSNYDHIALDSKGIKENDVVF